MFFGVRQNEARYRTASFGRLVLSENRQEGEL